MMMNIPFHSEEARVLNREIFETIYYAALKASMTLAARHGPYETFAGSPASQGILQFDMWGVDPTSDSYPESKYRTQRYDWNTLKTQIQKHGLRNSLLLAPMPTASTCARRWRDSATATTTLAYKGLVAASSATKPPSWLLTVRTTRGTMLPTTRDQPTMTPSMTAQCDHGPHQDAARTASEKGLRVRE